MSSQCKSSLVLASTYYILQFIFMSQEYVDSEISIREPIEKKKKLNVANESELFQGSCRQKCEPDGIWTIYIETSITGQLINSK